MHCLCALSAGKLCLVLLLSVPLTTLETGDRHACLDSFYPDAEMHIPSQTGEYLDWSSLRINGKLHFLTTTDSIYQFIGRPDSVVIPDFDGICVSFYDKDFKNAYFGGIEVEMYGDTSVVMSLSFKDDPRLKITSPSISMDHTTTLSDMARVYPNAVRNKHETDIHGFGKAWAITLNTSQIQGDDAWILFFSNDRLIRLDYWMPC